MTTERRRYFRIEDRALVKYRLVAEEDLPRERDFIQLNEIRAANLHAVLLGVDMRLQELIDGLREEHKAIAQVIELLNRKISVIERVVALENAERGGGTHREHEPADVSLSGGGLALTAATPLALNAYLAVDIVLLPSHHPMRAIGRVVDCRRNDDGQFAIAIEFDEIREEDRETLIQHIVRKQSANLREERRGRAA
ncbi:MAG: PilZ domain-containing protein [Gammaproteobacteria bacterium]|nr:PilZ domain-containing protein [Gammaproteobacteria bacterium]